MNQLNSKNLTVKPIEQLGLVAELNDFRHGMSFYRNEKDFVAILSSMVENSWDANQIVIVRKPLNDPRDATLEAADNFRLKPYPYNFIGDENSFTFTIAGKEKKINFTKTEFELFHSQNVKSSAKVLIVSCFRRLTLLPLVNFCRVKLSLEPITQLPTHFMDFATMEDVYEANWKENGLSGIGTEGNDWIAILHRAGLILQGGGTQADIQHRMVLKRGTAQKAFYGAKVDLMYDLGLVEKIKNGSVKSFSRLKTNKDGLSQFYSTVDGKIIPNSDKETVLAFIAKSDNGTVNVKAVTDRKVWENVRAVNKVNIVRLIAHHHLNNTIPSLLESLSENAESINEHFKQAIQDTKNENIFSTITD